MNGEGIGEKISGLLSENRITQKALADAVGVHQNVVSYWCKSVRTPNVEQITEIAKFFEVSADYLLGLSAFSTSNPDLLMLCRVLGLSEAGAENLVKALHPDEPDGSRCAEAFDALLLSRNGFSRLVSALCGVMEECEQANDFLKDYLSVNSNFAKEYMTGKVIDRMELSYFKADEAFRDAVSKAFSYSIIMEELRNH